MKQTRICLVVSSNYFRLSTCFFLGHFKISFISLEMRQEAKSALKSICYRSAESLVSLQSILAHQRSMPLYTLKCKKGKTLEDQPNK